MPPGGSLFVPPGTYYTSSGFICQRGDITIFGAGPSSRLVSAPQTSTLRVGYGNRLTRVSNINIHSLRFSQQAGPSGNGDANNFSGIKTWYADRVAVYNNDFENCDVGISFAGGDPGLGFPGRVTHRNMAVMNRMLNTRKMGIEIFFQDHAFIYGNQMINEDAFGEAASHGIRNIGSFHSTIICNEVRRFRTGISNQGGSSNGFRETRHFINSYNKFNYVLKGIMVTVDSFDGTVQNNTIENVGQYGLEFRKETVSSVLRNWDHVNVTGNLITANPNSTVTDPIGAKFLGGTRLVFRGNTVSGFGNHLTSGSAYSVKVEDIGRIAVVEGNYFEDAYYVSPTDRNFGVRADNNTKTVISRNNVFVSPSPNAAEQNVQTNSTGQFLKGFTGVADMNDYLA